MFDTKLSHEKRWCVSFQLPGRMGKGSIFCMMLHSVNYVGSGTMDVQELWMFNLVAYPDYPGGCVVLTILTRIKNDPLSRYIYLKYILYIITWYIICISQCLCLTFPIVLLHLNPLLRRQHFLQEGLFKGALFLEDFLRKH